jgi:glycosyltransferase involved in cell wall biosynthesis
MISVIMPVWNGARFMDRAIASVVAQTSPNWELLIVDDGSTDDSVSRAERWRDLINGHFGEEKIRVFSTGRSNSGPQIGSNLAAEHARHDIFAYLDQDDLYFPRRIQSLLPLFDQYDILFAPYEILENERVTIWNIWALWESQSYVCSSEGEREPPFERWVHAWLQHQNISVSLGVANRRKIFEEVGGFQPGILVEEEAVLWRRMAERGARIGFIPVIAGRYYVRPDSLARTPRPFSIPSFKLQRDHPLGSNGQYLDAEWFANLKKKKAVSSG